MTTDSTGEVVVGVDVGGPAKGFHAAAIDGAGYIGKFSSTNAVAVAQWCISQGAQVVAVDAPCRWRAEGQSARAAERQLAKARISCFSTPTENKARGHTFYTWMVAGAELYAALAPQFPLYDGLANRRPRCIETFPQAVACALAGRSVSAKQKLEVRSMLLAASGFEVSVFENIDEIDAALCALAARCFVREDFIAYGDSEGGFIVAPKNSLPSAGRLTFPAPVAQGKPGALRKILAQLPLLSASEHKLLQAAIATSTAPISSHRTICTLPFKCG